MKDWQEQILEREGFKERVMNLYEKLSPEALKVLDQEIILYPYSTTALIKGLKENRYCLDLTLNQCHRVAAVFGFECTLTNIINFFES